MAKTKTTAKEEVGALSTPEIESVNMKDTILRILGMPLNNGEKDKYNSLSESNGKNISVNDALIIAQVERAKKGDLESLVFLRDTAGLKPVEQKEATINVKGTGKLSEILDELTEDKE